MKNEYVFNGERLQKARIYRGLTVADLAKEVDCQRQTISMYENKKSLNPDENIIERISQLLNFPMKYFYEQSLTINTGSTYFRALLTTSQKYRDEQIQKMEFLAIIYSFLKDYVEFPKFRLPIFTNAMNIEEKAELLRAEWGFEDKPIDNIVFEIEDKGIITTCFETSIDSIDAFSQMLTIDDNDVYLIGYSNNKTSAARIHFDIAHELGHICLHDWSEEVEKLSKEDFRERENEANTFASAFLLPKKHFFYDAKHHPTSIPYYQELKKKWKVSMSAMMRRSYSLGLMTYDEYRNLMITLQKRGMRKNEPLDDKLITAEPSLLKTAVNMLLEQKVFTASEFINELSFSYGLSLSPSEIEYLLNLAPNTLDIPQNPPAHYLRVLK